MQLQAWLIELLPQLLKQTSEIKAVTDEEHLAEMHSRNSSLWVLFETDRGSDADDRNKQKTADKT
jgi:hypothetical protein